MNSARKLEIELRSASQGCVFTAIHFLPLALQVHCMLTMGSLANIFLWLSL